MSTWRVASVPPGLTSLPPRLRHSSVPNSASSPLQLPPIAAGAASPDGPTDSDRLEMKQNLQGLNSLVGR